MSDNTSTPTRRIEFITVADLQNVNDRVIPFGPIGEIVDIRTYRRWLPENKRRETALERWQRVINYNLNLVSDLRPYDELRAEALLMLDKYVALQADLSGRTKWVGGTDAAMRNPASQFNCSGLAVNRLSAFADAFNLLMLGVGVGFRVHQNDINRLPSVERSDVPIKFAVYNPVDNEDRSEDTVISYGGGILLIFVGDSRQGWVDALMTYLEVVTRSGKWYDQETPTKIIFNFDSVRPQGERLKGFGGTASGYQALQGIILDVQRIIQEMPTDRLRSIDCMDIMCAIAKGVVAGSSRRSAMICLFEDGDDLCANAKVGLYTNPELAHKSYRAQSNNTCQLTNKPSVERLTQLLDTCHTEGEPGFNNYAHMVQRRRDAAIAYRPDSPPECYTDVVTNPCHEILLSSGINGGESGSFCNLTTLPLPNFIADGVFDYDALESSIRLNTRSSLRQTCVNVGMPGWAETQLDERLLGVSLTGAQDAFALMGWATGGDEIRGFLRQCNDWANDEADKYATVLGVPRPLLVTTIKPEGTGSQVFGCSNGLHWDWAPYYIRRVRMTANDALAQTLIDQGFPCYPEIYDLASHLPDITDPWEQIATFDDLPDPFKRDILNDCNTVVFEFPVKSYSDRTQANVGAIEQLENVRMFTVDYCDHMPSSTITVKDGEWEDVAEWINVNWDDFITASFFPYSDAKYPLLPYEAITEAEYYAKVDSIPETAKRYLDNGRLTYVVDEVLLNKYERQLEDPDDVVLSSSGACPIR
jgi:ribonucleoside-diphosphate reductase alpha chain/ribonucleoside-triphosphate reductase